MLDQLFDNFRKASEATLRMQQDMMRHWSVPWPSGPSGSSGSSAPGGLPTDWGRNLQKEWLDLTLEFLNKQREALDSAYKLGLQMIEQTFRASEAKSPEEYRRMTEELWGKLFESFKGQYETQFQGFRKWTEKSFEMGRRAPG
jgi:hypothetical protein